jgi:hypothetical protein
MKPIERGVQKVRIVHSKRKQTLYRPIGFPKISSTKHKYVELISLTTNGLGTFNNYIYRANSLYDPRFNAGGHQPSGFDQTAIFYNKYLVTGCSINIHVMKGSGSASNPTYLNLLLNTDGNVMGGDLESIMEQGISKNIMMSDYADASAGYRISGSYSLKKVAGYKDVTDLLISDESADVTADPLAERYFVIGYGAHTPSQVSTVHLKVTLTYTAKWSEPRELPQS